MLSNSRVDSFGCDEFALKSIEEMACDLTGFSFIFPLHYTLLLSGYIFAHVAHSTLIQKEEHILKTLLLLF